MKTLKIAFCSTLVVLIILFVAYGILTKDIAPVVTNNTIDLTVHFIDVGQGDCTLLQTRSGNFLIDAGTFDSRYDIVDYIDKLGIKEFEYAIFTHPHEDHIGAAKTLLEKYEFKNVIMPNAVHTTPTFDLTLDAIENEGCNVLEALAGNSYILGNVKIDILAPDTYYDHNDLNNMSVVCKVTYGDVAFLFMGDAEEASEDSIRYHGYDIDADILKVGHHGSSTSSTSQFVCEVSPSVAVISAGKDNDYGHPHRETIQLLNNLGAETYITFDVGNIIVTTDGNKYDVITEK